MAIFKVQGENESVFDGEQFSREIRMDRDYPENRVRAMLPLMKHRFRCIDDDGITYFWGVCSSDSSFAPLDCLGAEYGCTAIEYKNDETNLYEAI